MNWFQRFKRSTAHTQANIVCTFVVMLATIAYVIVAGLQWLEIKRTNSLTQQALNGNGVALTETLKKMQAQVDATSSLYVEAQKQTTLMHDQTAGLTSAVVEVDGLGLENSGQCCVIPVYIVNIGHVVANDVTVKVSATEFSLDGDKVLEGPIHFTIGPLQLRPSTPDNPVQITKHLSIPNFTQDTWDSIARLERYVRIEAKWEYDNGFGRKGKNSKCFAYIDAREDFGDTAHNFRPTPVVQEVECTQLFTAIVAARASKRAAEENERKQWEQRNGSTAPR